MAKTLGEAREYSRGYNRALSRARDRVHRVLLIARGYRMKAAEAVYHTTAPRCVSCERWTRGGANCVWGYCRADFEYEAGEQKMWADTFVGETSMRRIVTQEMFGCVNWIAKPLSRTNA